MTHDGTISLGAATALAFSSIIGAGVLFVPGEIRATVNDFDVMVFGAGFLLAIATCSVISSLCFSVAGKGNSLPEIISGGLAWIDASFVPGLLSLALLLGLPVAAIYAADVIGLLIPTLAGRTSLVVLVLLAGALAVNLMSTRASVMVQTLIVAAIAFSVLLLLPALDLQPSPVRPPPSLPSLGTALLMGVLAFAGLENMPAVAAKFRHGRRMFFLAMVGGAAMALLVYLVVLLVIRSSGDTTPSGGVEWLTAPSETPALMTVASFLMVLAVIGNLITWNIGMTETWTRLIGRSDMHARLRIQLLTGAGYAAVIALIHAGILELHHAVAQAGAIFGMIYILLAASCLSHSPSPGLMITAAIILVLMAVIIILTPVYIILPTAVLTVSAVSMKIKSSKEPK